ncbi:type I restriction-modification system subunit M [Ichthyobacterium seriolicida]|uniref:site-specific DNA-methyltransferase (adenine-specific) n=1 Tax=Ichthyobacterium seriolicida TaxID=242600 RepID=A0A1J1E323_9FLAO|nr:class I SAM-dependent DNA methyltransferase [Ichthyobacterium seriolicida]BAV95365.1 type I restriction-modification system, DNA-methyltransferase subunit M [Ichthyobacterium seriolicida]
MINVKESANFIWSIADLLRGDYKQSDYGKVVLPLTVLRRLDCVLESSKDKVLKKFEQVKTMNIQNLDSILNKEAGYKFHNRSQFDFNRLIEDPENIAANLRNYINGFSEDAREIIEQFEFDNQITKLDDNNLLFMVLKRFQEVDFHQDKISSMEMGYIFEELIRKFAEISNETAGEHFTPREVIKLMVNLLFIDDRETLTQKGIIKTIYDCCAGTGGMLSVAEEYLKELNPDARLEVFGQELNPESYAICKSDMLIKGQNASNIKKGNSISDDQLGGKKFDYLITNPPFGVKWNKIEKKVKEEYEELGHGGRFGAGLPSVSDGSFLFLMHLMSKMKPEGSRLAIVFNGSPLFSGSPSSKKNESSIRKWIIENDMLEAVIALPNQLFYNTGISTYIWLITNNKPEERKGKVQLINAVDFFDKMRKALGDKRNELSDEHITEITKIYGDFMESENCKIFDNKDFGYSKVTVERPLMENGKIVTDKNGNPKPDSSLRDTENIPLKEDIQDYMEREVLPHVPDAWIDEKRTLIGYEINFTKYFYKYKPLRSLEEIRADILALENETDGLIKEVIA